ncbi:hypothetical protein [Streptomyces sp. NPDC058092]|uniref:hypothetical protein n=1 Tax=Streptomyces sp. NPDC058092 TaxID=3346336 RepID=UPI0036EDBDCB
MTARAWPSREEWQANAEYSVRTFCTPTERLAHVNPDAVWSTLAEDVEFEELATEAAKAARPLLTEEIARLRQAFPDRPAAGRARSLWVIELEGQRYDDACNLGALEEMRRNIQRAARNGNWGEIAWEVGRLFDHYRPAITMGQALCDAVLRMRALTATARRRHDEAADAVVEAAVAAEIARRATDEAWAQQLERRASIDSPRVIRVGAQTSPSKGDQVT